MKYGYLKLANATPNVTCFNPKANMDEIKKMLQKNDASIIAFPELAVTGYSCEDLFYSDELIKDAENEIEAFLKTNTFKGVVILGAPVKVKDALYNCAVVIQKNDILGIVPKSFLPNADGFMEKRWFSILDDNIEITYAGKDTVMGDILFSDEENKVRFAVEICYDMFSPASKNSMHSIAGANIIFNIAASTELLNKAEMRKNYVCANSQRLTCIYSYTSCGINESTSANVFGGDKIVAANGELLNRGKLFEKGSSILYTICDIDKINYARSKNIALIDSKCYVDFDYIDVDFKLEDKEFEPTINTLPFIPENKKEAFKTISAIQEIGLAKRIEKTCAKSLVVGVSGGLDSTLALFVAVKAFKHLGKDLKDIIAVTMPGLGTTKRTKSNATKLMETLGVTVREISIEKATLSHFEDIGHDENNTNVTYENAQARMRTLILMDIANDTGGLVLGTGDLSEIALGWSTYNGDQMSMYNVNADIPKTLVKFMCEAYATYEFKDVLDVIKDVLDTPISPELKKNQKTEDTVGKYEINDFILYNYLANGYSREKISYLVEKGFKIDSKSYVDNFFKRFITQQFKRSASPDGITVLGISLDKKVYSFPSDIKPNK